MAQAEPAEMLIRTTEAPPQKPPSNPFLSLVNKLLIKPQQQEKKSETGNMDESKKRVYGKEGNDKSDDVKFPLAKPEVPPLKLETEEADKDTNPIVLWQVFALGGFMVLRWAWLKWQERKAKTNKDSSSTTTGEEEKPPVDD